MKLQNWPLQDQLCKSSFRLPISPVAKIMQKKHMARLNIVEINRSKWDSVGDDQPRGYSN